MDSRPGTTPLPPPPPQSGSHGSYLSVFLFFCIVLLLFPSCLLLWLLLFFSVFCFGHTGDGLHAFSGQRPYEKVYEFMKELDSTVTVARRSNPVLL